MRRTFWGGPNSVLFLPSNIWELSQEKYVLPLVYFINIRNGCTLIQSVTRALPGATREIELQLFLQNFQTIKTRDFSFLLYFILKFNMICKFENIAYRVFVFHFFMKNPPGSPRVLIKFRANFRPGSPPG